MAEFDIINWLKKRFGEPIGDDCATIRIPEGKILLTVDEMVENVHFDWRYFSPQDVGYKAVSSACSDISAMGGKVIGILVALGLVTTDDRKFIAEIFGGIEKFIKPLEIKLLGGNISRSPNSMHITIAVIGTARKPIYRCGAKPGEKIWVTGKLGGTLAGYILLTEKLNLHISENCRNLLIARHKRPRSKIEAGEIIGKLDTPPSAMIDISDGFFQDLMHILSDSNVGANIELSRIPIFPGVRKVAKAIGENPYIFSAKSGEEYELLFTADVKKADKIEKALKKLNSPITCVGEILKKGISVTLDGNPIDTSIISGWQH